MEIKRVFDLLPFYQQAFKKEAVLANKINGQWVKYSIQDFVNNTNKVSKGLLKAGIAKGDRIAIISQNRPEWNFIDFGIQQIGGVSVPLYPTITESDYKYIFEDAQVKIIFVSTEELYNKVLRASQGIDGIQAIYTFDRITDAHHWSELKDEGKDSEEIYLETYKERVASEDLLTIIYTSGTTGNPKGVMLSHTNLISNFTNALPAVPIDHTADVLSFLPLCHIFERMIFCVYMRVGATVYYAESMETIGDNLKEVKPKMFSTVPRLLEKVYDKIVTKGYVLKGVKKSLFFWALNLGLKHELGVNQGWWYNTQLKLANKLIFSKWREALGGNIVTIVSGGAALQPKLARVFWAARIPVQEGYGLTETSPVIAVQRYQRDNARIGTVGTIIGGVEVKFAEDGEILVKSPGVMKGYYNRPDLTAEVIDKDGWFKTGDIGILQENKYLKITDRKKEIFKTSGGKYVAPQVIENKLKESIVIEQAMVVGEGQKFPSAIVVPALGPLKEWCTKHSVKWTDNIEELLSKPEVLNKYKKEIDVYNTTLAQYEQIKKFIIVKENWSIESGDLTPTLKLKRKVLLQKYQKEIELIYN